ncbi:hypothetical protein KBP30_41200 [Streptomyces sp. Go40/10]|uniref:hypothetical protein n=1 Tax=Streptomyces sp. Go40/10 TaxID=2825844 RepID=UPI001E46486C|nr:hypothetical protein [Streptomyces sp. Go40/10]UFR07157.1 hypothetical protein KBP30_41200 [Streptomyces sp. Go40/10]
MPRTTDSLLHRHHPWIGRTVEDTATGRRGILTAVAPPPGTSRPVAWLAPDGGREWTTSLGALANPGPITPDTHPGQRRDP